jgi:hypothetical protein
MSADLPHGDVERSAPSETNAMTTPYEQATETYLAEALAQSASVTVDSPNRARSHCSRGIWYLRNFDGHLIARVGKGRVQLVAS